MQTAVVHHSTEVRSQAQRPQPQFPLLELVTAPTVTTEQAAYYLNRKPQTLRGWACMGHGALCPVRVHGRLAWRVADIKAVLGVQ